MKKILSPLVAIILFTSVINISFIPALAQAPAPPNDDQAPLDGNEVEAPAPPTDEPPAGEDEESESEGALQIPVTSQRQESKIGFDAINRSTERILGDVEISVSDANNSSKTFTIYDPPKILTEISLPDGEYKLLAKRSGYEDYESTINTENDKKITVPLSPLATTPNPSINDYHTSGYMPAGPGYNYPNFNGQVYNTPQYYNYSQQPHQIVPFEMRVGSFIPNQPNGRINAVISQIPFDYGNPTLNFPIGANIPQNFVGCLNPNQPYYLSFYDDYHNALSRPYSFTTPQSGPYSLYIPTIDYSRGMFDVPHYSPYQPSDYLQQYRCPNYPYNQQNYFGTGQVPYQSQQMPYPTSQFPGQQQPFPGQQTPYSGQQSPYQGPYTQGQAPYPQNTSYPQGYGQNQLPQYGQTGQNIDLTRDYEVIFSPRDGNYYLINKYYQFDYRQISFVDRGDGKGGFAFFQSEAVYGNNNAWYVTLYTRNADTKKVDVRLNLANPTKISPREYANILNQKVIENFDQVGASEL